MPRAAMHSPTIATRDTLVVLQTSASPAFVDVAAATEAFTSVLQGATSPRRTSYQRMTNERWSESVLANEPLLRLSLPDGEPYDTAGGIGLERYDQIRPSHEEDRRRHGKQLDSLLLR